MNQCNNIHLKTVSDRLGIDERDFSSKLSEANVPKGSMTGKFQENDVLKAISACMFYKKEY